MYAWTIRDGKAVMIAANVTGRQTSIPSTLGTALIECLRGVPRRARTYQPYGEEGKLGEMAVRENPLGGFPWDPEVFPAMLVEIQNPNQPLLFGTATEMSRSQKILEETF